MAKRAAERDKDIRRLYEEGLTIGELMSKYKLPQYRIEQILGPLKRGWKEPQPTSEVTLPAPPEVKMYQMDELPQGERERIAGLHDPYHEMKRPRSGYIPRYV